MVGIGTIFTIGIIGAVIAGGYALSRNTDKIGSALSRGVEGYLTNPLGNWFDNLWTDITNVSSPATSGPSSLAGETVASYNDSTITIPADTTVNTDGTVSSDTPPLLTLSEWEKQYAISELEKNRLLTIAENEAFEESIKRPVYESGYYFINTIGSVWDTQQYLTSFQAGKYAESYKAEGDYSNIHYIGQDALGEAGFKLFQKSQNYL